MLIDQQFETKFMEVFSGLRSKDPKILKTQENLFADVDEKMEENAAKKSKKEEKVTLKDQIRKEVQAKMDADSDDQDSGDDDSDEGIFKKKRGQGET